MFCLAKLAFKKGTREMNANELADEIMEHYKATLPKGFNVNWMKESATMLRQQQAEIEALKSEKIRAYDNGYEDGRKPDTNPKSAKTLTDEEIDAVGDEVSNLIDTYAGRRDFARAILRKAQENGN